MPRQARVHYIHAMYHVMLQGNYRQNIFHDHADFYYFYGLLKKATIQYHCKIHIFCLMTNHIHLLIEVRHVPLKKIMQTIATSYANYVNKKLKRNGHLFRGRYLDKIIEDERYMLELFYYIHMNPVQAKMVQHVNNYPWSSYHCYTKERTIDWVTTLVFEKLLAHEKENKTAALFLTARQQRLNTPPQFCRIDEQGLLIINARVNSTVQSVAGLDLKFLSVLEIAQMVCKYLDISFSLLTDHSKKESLTMARTLVAYYAHYHGMYKIKHIAQLLHCNADTLSKTMHRQFSSEKKREQLHAKMKALEQNFIDVIATHCKSS